MKFIIKIGLLFSSVFAYSLAQKSVESKSNVSSVEFENTWLQYNPIFQDNKNTLSFIGALDFSSKGFSHLGALGLHYGQPNTFFRLPGRMSLEFEGFIGDGAEKSLSQFIFGVSQDIIFPIYYTNIYVGAGIGIYIRTIIDTRIGSAFTFGEKVFLGYAYRPANIWGGGGYIPVKFL